MKRISYLFSIVCILIALVSCNMGGGDSEKEQLATPSNISVTYDSATDKVTINFDEVENATNYTAYFYQNNEVYRTFDVTNGMEIPGVLEGTYQVEIKAIDETNVYKPSDISAAGQSVTVVKQSSTVLTTPTGVVGTFYNTTGQVVITFNTVENASSYQLVVYSNNQQVKEQAIVSGDSIELANGSYTFKVRAIGDGVIYKNSGLSAASAAVSVVAVTPETTPDLTSISFMGLASETIPYGSQLNIMSGIRVVGNDGATYLVDIETTSSITLVDNCIPADYVGEVTFTYSAEYSNLKASGTKKVTVLDESGETEGKNLIVNGDFTTNTTGWTLSNHEGASSAISVSDGAIKVAIYALNQSNASSPRINSQLFTLEKGVTYVVSFDAWAAAGKAIQVQVGELFDVSPYFTNYMGGDAEVFVVDTNKKNYSFTFKYEEATSNNVTILFEMGIVTGITTITDVYYDNIQIKSTSAKLVDLTIPSISGVDDKTLYVGSKQAFDPLAGVSAYDETDGNLTDRVAYTIKQNGELVSAVSLAEPGEYEIFYVVSDNSYNTIQKICPIEVVSMPTNEGNLLVNGDFTNGIQAWQVVTHEGGFADRSVVDGMMKIEMTGINWNDNSSSPRLNNFTPFTLIAGEAYKVSFDAKADEVKNILVQIGELYEMAPYWLDLKPQTTQTYTLTTSMQHYEFLFVNEMVNTKRGFVTFEMGVVNDDKTITNVYFDNIVIEHLDYSIGDYMAPDINGVTNLWYFANEITEFDPLAGVSVLDNVDGDLTNSLTYQIYLGETPVESIDLTTQNEYQIAYEVTDSNNNTAVKRIKVTILPAKSTLNNLLATTTWTKNPDGVSDFVIQTIPGGACFQMSPTGGSSTWDVRAVSSNVSVTNGAEYTIYFDLVSTAERDIFVQVGNYSNTSYFQVQYSKVMHISTTKTRYMIQFIANASGQFALGFEMGPGSSYDYVEADVTVTNFVMVKGKTYLSTPTGIVFNTIPQGTILAFAALYSGNVKFLLYVYDSNNQLIDGAPFSIFNGQNLNDLAIPSGTYTLKIQAVGTTDDIVPSDLTKGYTYTR